MFPIYKTHDATSRTACGRLLANEYSPRALRRSELKQPHTYAAVQLPQTGARTPGKAPG